MEKIRPAYYALSIFCLALAVVAGFFIIRNTTANTSFFSLVVLPDTQKYAEAYPDIFSAQTRWVVENKQERNILFVAHVGDVVQHGAAFPVEWEVASHAFSLLETANIPYSILPGNKDAEEPDFPSADFNQFNTTFPLERISTTPFFGGNYQHSQNTFHLFSTGGIDFLVVSLEVDPADDVLEWAKEVLAKHPTRSAIVITHAYLGDEDGSGRLSLPHFRLNGNSGEDIWRKLIAPHCSIFLVLSGHTHLADGENSLESVNNCNQPVFQITQNYQGRENGGNGLLRIYTFSPKEKTITASTYSPVTGKYELDEDSSFNIPLR